MHILPVPTTAALLACVSPSQNTDAFLVRLRKRLRCHVRIIRCCDTGAFILHVLLVSGNSPCQGVYHTGVKCLRVNVRVGIGGYQCMSETYISQLINGYQN